MDFTYISRLQTTHQDVNDLHNELFKEVNKLGDDAEGVLRVMDKHGFYRLSEETKLYLLCGNTIQHGRHNVWQKVIQANKINTMIALLPLTPLFAIDIDNIPPQKWIENQTWIRNILYEKKLRWNPSGCRCRDHKEPSSDLEKLCALTNIAFTMFAADLFHETGMQWIRRNDECALFLLHVAPNLLTIKVSQLGNVTQLKWAVLRFRQYPDILDMLIRQVTCGENVGEILTSLLFSADHVVNHCHTKTLRFLIDTVVRGKEEEIRYYRDDNGNSVLHIACSTRNPSQLHWLKELLRIGLDLSVRNNQNKTALDVLICSFFNHFWNLTEHEDETDSLHFIVRSFIQAVHMFLPSFKDTPIFEIKLPHLRSIRYPSVESINDACITVYSTFLNSAIFPDDTEKNLAGLLSWKMHQCKRHYPCVFCKSLVELMHQALHTGLNLYKHVSKFQYGRQATLPESFLCHSLGSGRRIRLSICTCHVNSTSVRPEPCVRDWCGHPELSGCITTLSVCNTP